MKRLGFFLGVLLVGLTLMHGLAAMADGPELQTVDVPASLLVDDWAWLQGEADRIIASGGGELLLTKRVYYLGQPLVIRPNNNGMAGLTLRGSGSFPTAIIKTTNAKADLPPRKARSGTVADEMKVDAVIVIDHPDNQFARYVTIENLGLYGVGAQYGIYAPRLSQSALRDLRVQGVETGIYGFQWFLCQVDQVMLFGLSRERGTGFHLADDGTGKGGSTTTNLRGVYANVYRNGYRAFGLHYSAWDGLAADNIGKWADDGGPSFTGTAYWFEYCRGLSLSGSGTENVAGRTLKIVGGAVNVSGFYAATPKGTSSETGTVELHGCRATISAGYWNEMGGDRRQYDVRYGVAGGDVARVTWIGCQLPSGGAGAFGDGIIKMLP